MHFLQSQFRRIHTVLLSLLILLCIVAAPDRPWANAPAAAQCPAITLTPASLPAGVLGAFYSQDINATGGAGNYIFSIIGGSLSLGLTLTPARQGRPTLRIFWRGTAVASILKHILQVRLGRQQAAPG